MENICVLLNGPIYNDNRVIKIINTLSLYYYIDLYYINGKAEDVSLFNDKVELFSSNHKTNLRTKIIQHSCFWREFNFLIQSISRTKKHYDIVWCNDLPTLSPGYQIAKKQNAWLIYDSHEIYLETLNQFFPAKNSILKSILIKMSLAFMKFFGKRVENRLIHKADQIITVNESLAHYFEKNYSVNQVKVVMNCPPLTNLKEENFIDFKKLFSFNDKDKVLIYQGFLNKGRGLEIIINTMEYLPVSYKLIILGDGPLKKDLKELTNKLNLVNQIKFIDKVPISELLNYTSGADYGINILENYNLSKKLASPNKLFEYIHAEIPVICSNTIENRKVINKYKIGIMVENDSRKIAESIINLSKSSVDSYKLACKKALKEYNWDAQEKVILNAVKKNPNTSN